MDAKSSEEIAILKRDLYEKLSKRQRKYVDRIGYEAWESFKMMPQPFMQHFLLREQIRKML